jgi:integrase/recombinase XerC
MFLQTPANKKGNGAMAQGRQAKTLTEGQIKAALSYLEKTRYAARDQVIFLLSVKAGLRAKEIAALTWAMLTDAEGQVSDCIHLPDIASKGNSGRDIPLNKQLRDALIALQTERAASVLIEPDDPIAYSERGGGRMKANSIVMWFQHLYNKQLSFDGCSSHSGRRTFITNASRKVSLAGGSLRDVQQLAGHSSLQTTQRYVEGSTEAKQKLVNLI